MRDKKPKRFFEKSGLVDPDAPYYEQLENVTNMNGKEVRIGNYGSSVEAGRILTEIKKIGYDGFT